MSLTYAEANLFCRAGDDMRRAAFPSGDFIRLTLPPHPVAGYVIAVYAPSNSDLAASDWQRA